MTAPWWTWTPEAACIAAWAWLAWRSGAFRRRPAKSPDHLIAGREEAHIAVGSLSGIAPSDIRTHVLIVVTADDGLVVAGTCPERVKAFIVAQASMHFAGRALAEQQNGSAS